MTKDLKISIITVTLNSEMTLEKTIKSVIDQKYEKLEYIIIDGKSKDGTLDIIDKYKNSISKIISEDDKGIYDAFNKGLKNFTGDVVGFVNSDDYLYPGALNTVSKYLRNNPSADFIFGSVKKHWGILHGYNPWKIFYTWNFYSSHSTGFYIRKNAAQKVGLYDTQYRFSADYDYFYRMIVHHKLNGISTKKDEVLGNFGRGGFSSSIDPFDHICECTKIRFNNGQNKFMVFFTFILKFIFYIKKIKKIK